MTPIDAVSAYADGTLRRIVVGRVRSIRREGRDGDLLDEVAIPLADLAAQLTAEGKEPEASRILEHAIHDGVSAANMAKAVAAHATAEAPPPGLDEEIKVGPLGELRAGPPPPADDLASALALVNDLRDRLT